MQPGIVWDTDKEQKNVQKHGVSFPEDSSVLDDDQALTIEDHSTNEERYITLGMSDRGRLIVTVFTYRGDTIRIISARLATKKVLVFGPVTMKSEHDIQSTYDFSEGKRGAIIPLPPGKERITIRLDADILDLFRQQASQQGGGNYQTMINQVLRDYLESQTSLLEDMIRRVVREELAQYHTE